ncbi:MAG TPA: hypothetical protein ENK37_08345 [Oceanithermus profundus]|uniref:Uncharacterized protein n=1 Tax=Oceanithermus profundus TaxID=187137 RepID=A0A7C4VLG3_9DEIN|nr:hypothetical protein [Oceanithermus profundus]
MSEAPSLWAVASHTGEVREVGWPEGGLGALAPRLVAVWLVVGGGVRYIVRAGTGPWPPPEPGSPGGPDRWAREDAARFAGRVRYRIVTRDPWMTLDEGLFLPGQLGFGGRR